MRDLIIVGSGPAGLAAAISAKQQGLDYQVLEKGMLVNTIFHFPANMVFFTTPELLEIGSLPFVTPYEKPTRLEALRYYRRVVDTYDLDIAFGEEVTAVYEEREHPAGSTLLAVECRSNRGVRRVTHARSVVLATGCYDHPNLIGVPGEDLPHVSHYYTDPHAFYRKSVVIVGGKNSAAEAALDLHRAGARVTIVHRHAALGDSVKYWVKPDIENRITEGSITARFNTRVTEIRPTSVVVEREDSRDEIPADGIFLLTGYRSDTSLLARAGVHVMADTCAPEYDPDTFETNVAGLYVAGSLVSGHQSGLIFIENGRSHGESIVAEIVKTLGREGRRVAATES
ncbi:MAG: YpdA family putative bacillithiol disulfide reductase [Acidobacteria bacterium]|nr:YpdA family putative bacillithiol disulfide reductase [Acidobacteriota bacterium]